VGVLKHKGSMEQNRYWSDVRQAAGCLPKINDKSTDEVEFIALVPSVPIDIS